jgi:hypothetical protein
MENNTLDDLNVKIQETSQIINNLVKNIPFDYDISNCWELIVTCDKGEMLNYEFTVENVTFASINLKIKR